MNSRMPIKEFSVFLAAILLIAVEGSVLMPVAAQTATPTESAPSMDVTFPDLTGPYKVGRTAFEWIDQSRDDISASAAGLKRDLMVYVWFPASINKRTKIAPYMDGGFLWDMWSKHPGLESMVHTHAYDTYIPDPDKPSYPVLIFDPGFSGISLNYAAIIEDIASQGYIVIGMSHPYTTAAINYPDGRYVVSGFASKGVAGDAATLATWTQDVRFALDQAEKLNEDDRYFKGTLDLTHVGMFGHSFGAENSIELTAIDPRIKAGASLDGTTATDVGNKPFLFVGADVGNVQHPQDKYWLLIDGTAHLNYGDFGLLVPLLPNIKLLGNIDPARGVKIVNGYLLAFFDHYLKGVDLKWPAYNEAHLAVLNATAATSTN